MIRVDYRLTNAKLNERGLYSVLHSQRGPVARHIRLKGARVMVVAKALAGVRTGRLKKSIKMTRDRTYRGEYAILVGSDLHYALVHHEGARPHSITPKKPGGVLRFRGRGGVVYAHHVNHPGHRPNPYLVTALRRVIRG
jgi:hypothetical protein